MDLVELIRGEVSVKQACEWLEVPRSTFYRWKAAYETRNIDVMVQKVRELCLQHKFRYGYRKITSILQRDHRINHKRIQQIMQREQLQCRVRVKKRKATGQPAYIAEHLLKRQFQADAPMHKLVTDITYLPFGGKTLYLSSILDLFNGEVVVKHDIG